MAAKSSKSKSGMGLPIADMKYVPSTDMHVNLKKFPSADGYDVGDVCSFTVKGKVTSISKNEDSETMTVEISKIAEDEKGDSDADSEA